MERKPDQIVECDTCGLVQQVAPLPRNGLAECARCGFRVGLIQVNFRETQASTRLTLSFIHGVDFLFGFGLALAPEALRIADQIVKSAPYSPRAFELPITLRHILHFHFVRL